MLKYNTEFLNNLAYVHFGVHPKSEPSGKISVVQVKDIIDGSFNPNNVIRMPEAGLKERDFLRAGDVLFSGKGRITAMKWNNEGENVVASNSFFVIRVKKERVLPEFLAAYLRSSSLKKEIGRKTKSSTVMHLSIEDVRDLRIPLPPIEEQKKFARVAELLQEEKRMSEEIILRKEKILNHLL
ncbi:MAG TPA: restriction endonuclease subunit S [Bacteroidia bacterium]|jgi:type I restriction enzyme S subunit|nr:restriction endonuclease subunit S [Bacteroidia bacterium]